MGTGAQKIVSSLEQASVDICFGLPGVHNLPLWEEIRKSPIRLVGVRHEQTAAYAADGFARASGRLGVALTTTGPGAANTLGAVGEAWASRSPILVIATDIPASLRRPGIYRGVLHETTDQAAMFRPVVKRTFTGETKPVAAEVEEAIAVAMSTPTRPVYVQVPTDQFASEVSENEDLGVTSQRLTVAASDAELTRAVELIDRAERPLLWVGSGARDAGAEVTKLAEVLAAPVLTTYGGRGVIEATHPCAVGLPPHVEPAGRLWDDADLVIGIGTDFDGMNTQNWAMEQPPAVIAINCDPHDATKNYRVDMVLEGDAAAVSQALSDRVKPRTGHDDIAGRLHHVRAQATAQLDERALEFLDALAYALPSDAVLVCDMCIPGYWVGAFYPFCFPRKLLYPVGWGTLGFGFPAAIGAALADTGPTVAICGDGGFLFACGELATVAQEQIPLTIVIVDDGGYGMLRYDQEVEGLETYGVDLKTPDFAAMAEAFGIRAQTVYDVNEEFGAALAEHIADPKPSVLVAKAPALVPPPTTSPQWYRRKH